MEKYTELNNQMEQIACIIRSFYLFEDKRNTKEEVEFICNFVEEMRSKESLDEVDIKYRDILDEYLPKVDNIKDIAPNIKM